MRTLSGEICLSNDVLILTGSCLEMRSDAFRIGLGAADLGGAGLLFVPRLGPNRNWPLRELATPASKTTRSNMGNFAGIVRSAATVAVYALKPTR